jgi:hypothetical protein
VQIHEDYKKLLKASWVNYSKLIAVEYNVKVFFYRRVVSGDWDIVLDVMDIC